MTFPKIHAAAIIAATAMVLAAPLGTQAITPAGYSITTSSTANYKNSAGTSMPTATSNTVTVAVGESTGVALSAPLNSLKVRPGQAVSFPIVLANTGNSRHSFALSTAGAPSGWPVKFIADTNSDGIRQSSETTEISDAVDVPAGTDYHFFLEVSAPSSVAADESVNVSTTAKSTSSTTTVDTIQLTAHVEVSPYYTTWLMNGPYFSSDKPTRLLTEYIDDEAFLAPRAGDVDGGRTWAVYSGTTDRVDLNQAFGHTEYCTAYAFSYVYSPVAQSAEMRVGSDDGVRVWLDGNLAWSNNIYRGFTLDQDSLPISLNAGWNRLLVKISQGTGSWAFSVRICDSAGQSLPGVTQTTDVPDSEPPVISDVRVSDLGPNTATISWTTDEPATSEVEYTPLSITGPQLIQAQPGLKTSHSIVLTGLTPGTVYLARLVSVDAFGNVGHIQRLFTTAAAATEPDPDPDPDPTPSPYVTEWIINGYYSNPDRGTRLSTDYLGNEAEVRPTLGEFSGGKQWVLPSIDASLGRVEFHPVYGMPEDCAGYAHTYIYSPLPQQVEMWLGSDDGAMVWVNGSLVWVNDTYRACTADQDRFEIMLDEGWNSILLKVSNGKAAWRFTARFCDADGGSLPGLMVSATRPEELVPIPDPDPITDPTPAGFILDWIINGYYSNPDRDTRLSTNYIGNEAQVRPTIGEFSGGRQWVRPSIHASLGRVEFHPVYNMPENCAGYAHTYIYSPTSQQGQMWLGSDDGVMVWVNGSVVWVNDTYRGCTADQDRFPITLAPGWNSVLLKVTNGKAAWRFTARICDANGYSLNGLEWSSTRP